MKLASFSIYGNMEMYQRGLIRNAQLMLSIYPGWTMRVYCEPGYPRKRLNHLGVQVQEMKPSRGHTGMLWRFLPAFEEVERVIFRDADSRINPREAAAVKEWEESGLDTHSMHDHEHHRSYPLFGGMWGIKGGVLPTFLKKELNQLIQKRRLNRVDDMRWLAKRVLPQLQEVPLHHSSVPIQWDSRPFPKHEEWEGFVGEKIVVGAGL